MKLRPYEEQWLERICESEAKRVLVVGPTGSGKTVVAVELAKRALAKRKRVLFLAHRIELLAQAVERLEQGGVPPESIGTIAGKLDRENDRARIQVASIQAFDAWPADVIIIDEAHHACSATYRELLLAYPRAQVYGLTATPYRMDGAALGEVFEELIQSAPPSELVSSGWLARPLVYTVPPEQRPKLLGVRKVGADWAPGALARASDLPHLIGSVVDHYHKFARKLPTVVYGVNIAHCESILAAFKKSKVKAASIYGHTPFAERVLALEQLEQGDLSVIVNCQLLTEGWDCPIVRCAIVARPTLSTSLWFQIVGRVTRPGAIRPIVLDHAGNAILHGLPLEDVDYSLDKAIRGVRLGEYIERICPSCQNSVRRGTRICPFCETELISSNSELPETVDGTLVRVNVKRIRAKCSYEHCPTPHLPVERRVEHGPALHWGCKRAKRVFCTYDKCPTPEKPLSPQSTSDMHRDCQLLAHGRKKPPSSMVKCSYEHCPTPDVLFRSKNAGQNPIHDACRTLINVARRKCQYDKCQTPEVLLSHKAHFQGVTMHSACAGRNRSEKLHPDRKRCKKCAKAHVAKSPVKLINGLCVSCYEAQRTQSLVHDREN